MTLLRFNLLIWPTIAIAMLAAVATVFHRTETQYILLIGFVVPLCLYSAFAGVKIGRLTDAQVAVAWKRWPLIFGAFVLGYCLLVAPFALFYVLAFGVPGLQILAVVVVIGYIELFLHSAVVTKVV
jgi:hypothetical protein